MTKPKSKINQVAATRPAPKAPKTAAPKAPEVEAEKAPEVEAGKAPEAEAEKAPKVEEIIEVVLEKVQDKIDQAKQKKPKSKYPESIVKRAKEVFESHTNDEIFFTSDESCFTIEQYAVMHSQNLKDQDVLTVKRSEVE